MLIGTAFLYLSSNLIFVNCHSCSDNCLVLQHKKPADGMLLGSSSRNPVGEAPASPKYSDRLSPAINNYLSEASRQEVRVSQFL